ncbi:MAG: peptidylprolyl isomerase [Longimicrobiales bacterium]
MLLVGDVGYAEAELGALSGSGREELADLTAFGLAVAQGSVDSLASTLAAQDEQSELLQRLAAEIALREAGLSEDSVRRLYQARPEHELTVRHLVVLAEAWQSEAKHGAARARAQAALERIRGGEPFEVVAADVSEEPGAAERGGLLEPGRRGTWVTPFWDAASRLDPGQVSDVVQTRYGYHVLRLERRAPLPLEAVRARVLGRLSAAAGDPNAARHWAERQAAGIAVLPEALAGFRAGALPHDAAVAQWPDGELTAAELERVLMTADPAARARLETAADDVLAGVVLGAARNALLAARARELGLGLEPTERARLTDARLTELQDWSATLGFAPGRTDDQVKAAALAALAAQRQSVAQARAGVAALAPLLRRLYPVHIRDTVA